MNNDNLKKSTKTETGVEKVIGKGTYPGTTSNAIKSVVADYGGTATSAYSHPVNYNKPPIFSSGGLSIHESQGGKVEPHPSKNEENETFEEQLGAD
ncbi:hypothetical protein [Rummeliibacillus pycnus]|uniref:hypothetical protein n=1 Tax=Rummeliibacillus pycnus TaxID=101070 RepID=UPI0037C7947C